MFQIKNFDSIVASMINNITSVNPNLSDFNVGSKVRTLLESVGHEIDTFYQVLLKGLYEAIEVAIYKTFSFTRLAASASSGYVTFTRTAGTTGVITIPAGTQVKVPNSSIVYATSGRASLLEGSDTVDVTVVANATGASGNASANTITEIVSSISGIQSVNNARSFINGRNEETDNERKNRFQRWIRSLARATRDSLAYGASLAEVISESGIVVERVVEAVVHEPCVDDTPPGPPGYVNVYLWNGVDGASSELIANARALLYGYADESGTRVAGWKGAGVI
ncbi:MAG: baseplate J/gp47 family protein, partial [Desulfatiglandales bacterium]